MKYLPPKIIILLLALSLVFLAATCDHRARPVKVGANVWPGYEPLFLAQALKLYGDAPVEVSTFPSNAEVMRAYRNGVIDVAAVTLDEALSVAEHQEGQRVILVCDFSSGADVVIAKPGISSLSGLRGKRVGVEQNALGAFMLSRALEAAGLTSTDISVVGVPLEEHEGYFAGGKVDAIVTFEPHAGRILAAGGTVLFDSSKIPGEIVDVLLTSDEVAKAASGTLSSLIGGWFAALDYLRANPLDAARVVAPRERISPEEFLTSLKLLKLPSREENRALLGGGVGSLRSTALKMRKLMVANALVMEGTWVLPTFDPGFIGGGR